MSYHEEAFMERLYAYHRRVCDCAFTAAQHRCELLGWIDEVGEIIGHLVSEIEGLENENVEKIASYLKKLKKPKRSKAAGRRAEGDGDATARPS